MTLYGKLPDDLGEIDISPTEMCFWMYTPISLPGQARYVLPDNLKQFAPIVSHAKWARVGQFEDAYVYLTAKTLWVEGSYIGNRPGWHSDGFGTDDINYIWCDRAPTEFVKTETPLSDDCDLSMRQMAAIGKAHEIAGRIFTYPDKHLLRLDQRVIHRSPAAFPAGMRTFVKVSLSADRYDLIGNSRNHSLPGSDWPLVPRRLERNHPQSRLA
jgi:hypothetical protein